MRSDDDDDGGDVAGAFGFAGEMLSVLGLGLRLVFGGDGTV